MLSSQVAYLGFFLIKASEGVLEEEKEVGRGESSVARTFQMTVSRR